MHAHIPCLVLIFLGEPNLEWILEFKQRTLFKSSVQILTLPRGRTSLSVQL